MFLSPWRQAVRHFFCVLHTQVLDVTCLFKQNAQVTLLNWIIATEESNTTLSNNSICTLGQI